MVTFSCDGAEQLACSTSGDSKPGRYLREHRLRLTLWIGAIEGMLALLGVIPHLAVYVLAIVAIAWCVAMGRKYTSPAARQSTWIFAASQAIAVLIPAPCHIVKWLAIAAIVHRRDRRARPPVRRARQALAPMRVGAGAGPTPILGRSGA